MYILNSSRYMRNPNVNRACRCGRDQALEPLFPQKHVFRFKPRAIASSAQSPPSTSFRHKIALRPRRCRRLIAVIRARLVHLPRRASYGASSGRISVPSHGIHLNLWAVPTPSERPFVQEILVISVSPSPIAFDTSRTISILPTPIDNPNRPPTRRPFERKTKIVHIL